MDTQPSQPQHDQAQQEQEPQPLSWELISKMTAAEYKDRSKNGEIQRWMREHLGPGGRLIRDY
jgi:hypothetical protein